MLDECLRIFKQELKDNTNLVLNTIILADGDYVLVHSDGTYDVEKIKYSKSQKMKYMINYVFMIIKVSW